MAKEITVVFSKDSSPRYFDGNNEVTPQEVQMMSYLYPEIKFC